MSSTMLSARVAWQLMRRECKVIVQKLTDSCVNVCLMSVLSIIMIKTLLPAFGVSRDLMVPLVVGQGVGLCFFMGYSYCMSHAFDITGTAVVRYFALLPLPVWCVVGVQVISLAVSLLIVTVPSLLFSVWYVSLVPLSLVTYVLVVLYLVLVALFISSFFYLLAFARNFHWYIDDAWPQLLMPLYAFSGYMFSWEAIAKIAPRVGSLLLCNPLLYTAEGVRGIVSGQHTVPVFLQAMILFVLFVFTFYGATRFFSHRLHLVTEKER